MFTKAIAALDTQLMLLKKQNIFAKIYKKKPFIFNDEYFELDVSQIFHAGMHQRQTNISQEWFCAVL